MLVVGSASEVTREQLRTLNQERPMVAVEVNPFRLIAGAEAAAEVEQCTRRLVAALQEGQDVVLHVASSRRDVSLAQSLGQQVGLTPAEVSARIVSALGHITRLVADACDLRGLVLTGGDTAKMVCGRLGATGIHIWEEVEPGIPLGRLVGEHEMLVVTKAGAFGSPQALIRSLEAIKNVV
jgi:D-threonate/D-erythronate kinase